MLEIAEKTDTAQLEQIKGKIMPLEDYAKSLIVNSSEVLTEAGRQLLTVKDMVKIVDNYFDPDIGRAHEIHKSLCGKKKVFIDGLKTIYTMIDQKTIIYRLAEERKVALAQAESDKKQRELQEKAEAQAKKELAKGNSEKAQAIMENIPQFASPVPEPTKIEGMSKLIETYKAEIVDINKIPRNYLLPDMSALNKVGQATKGMAKIPGVKFVKETSQRTTGRR